MKELQLICISFLLYTVLLAQELQPFPLVATYTEGEEIRDATPISSQRSKRTKWTMHITEDGLHPNAFEQQMIWLMNRARSNPSEEGAWLASTEEAGIKSSIDYFGVDVAILRREFNEIQAKPPAVFDRRLYLAAEAHSEYLKAAEAQNHDGQFQRIKDNNFSFFAARGSVFAYARDPIYSHAAFNIDWGGNSPDGMQEGRGHRNAIMSTDGDYTNVGIAAVFEEDPSSSVGPYIVTGNYAKANPNAAQQFNIFITGTIWEDDNNNQLYDMGEGVSNIEVSTLEGNYFAEVSANGGYAIPIESSGTYTLIFKGAIETQMSVQVEDASVLVDIPLCTQGMPCDRTTSVIDINDTDLVQIYPNPFRDQVKIEWGGVQQAMFSIYNLSNGQLILRSDLHPESNIQQQLNYLPKGLYLFRMLAGENTYTSKLLKE